MTETEIKQRLEEIKHQMYLAKRESQILRLELRTNLLREQAQKAVAAGKITEADVQNVRSKWNTFKQEVGALKAAGTSTKASRAACTAAWDDLSSTLRSTREKAGVAAAR